MEKDKSTTESRTGAFYFNLKYTLSFKKTLILQEPLQVTLIELSNQNIEIMTYDSLATQIW